MTSPPACPADGSPREPHVEEETAGPSLEARDLVRSFGPIRAVDGVSFRLRPGELLTVFGPNGAGKSTLLNLLSGGLQPSAGEISMGGSPRRHGDVEWRRRVGILSHQTFLYGHLTAEENLRFYARLFGVEDREARIRERLEAVDLLSRRHDPVRSFSRGMRQRLGLARALLHGPEIVLLDEPYTGLDVHAAGLLRDLLGSLKDGRRTVVLVTHDLAQGLELADRIAIQVRGRFEFVGSAGELPREPPDVFYRRIVEGALSRPGAGSVAGVEGGRVPRTGAP